MEAPGSIPIAPCGQGASVTPAAAVSGEPRINSAESAGQLIRMASDQIPTQRKSLDRELISHPPMTFVKGLSPIDHHGSNTEAEQAPEPDTLHWPLQHDVECRVDQDR